MLGQLSHAASPVQSCCTHTRNSKRARAHAHARTHAPQHGDCIVNAKQVLRKSAELEAKAQSEYAREQGGVLAHGARTHTPMREPMGIYSKHPEDAR